MVDQTGDPRQHRPRRELPWIETEILERASRQRPLVVGVSDSKVRRQSCGSRVPANNVERPAVERADKTSAERAADEALYPLAHLPRRLVGEGHRGDSGRLGRAHGQQVGNAVGEDAGLAGAGAGEHQQRALAVGHGLTLRRVEIIEKGAQGTGTSRGRKKVAARPRRLNIVNSEFVE